MQTFNYHGHTKRCGHATGEDEEYVLAAIQNGYKRIGFSDHMPYKNGNAPGERMNDDELEDYVTSIKALQCKYQDQIEIRIGLEFENYQEQLDEIWANKKRFDYMILGEHEPAMYAPDFYQNYSDADTMLYAKMVVKAIQEEIPDIVAHPDLFMFGKPEFNEACHKATHMICKAAQDHKIPLEINLNGVKYGLCKRGKENRYLYPYRGFWEIASQYKVKVLYGLDAHQPDKYADKECFRLVQDVIKGLSLDFIQDLQFPSKI